MGDDEQGAQHEGARERGCRGEVGLPLGDLTGGAVERPGDEQRVAADAERVSGSFVSVRREA